MKIVYLASLKYYNIHCSGGNEIQRTYKKKTMHVPIYLTSHADVSIRQSAASGRGRSDGEAVPVYPAPARGMRTADGLSGHSAADAGRLPDAAGRPADQLSAAAGRVAGQQGEETPTSAVGGARGTLLGGAAGLCWCRWWYSVVNENYR